MNHPLRWLALVAIEDPALPEAARLGDFVEQRFADAPPLESSATTEGILTGTIGDDAFAITLVPRPIPAPQLEGPCATAWYWPQAAESFAGHSSHLFITLVDEGGRAVEKSQRLTELAAAAASAVPARGIFWGPGRLVHRPEAFIEQAVQMRRDDLPLFLWVDFRIERTGPEQTRLYTTGLEALGGSELEADQFEGSPQELLEHAYNVAHYLLVGEKSIEQGHTIGLSDEVRATVHRKPSMLDASMEVICLEFSRGE